VLILAIHSTSLRLGVAVARDGRVLEEVVLAPGREHLESLAPIIQQLLERQRLVPADMDAFAAAVGPGSFSGIRIGLATVKGMALALGKPAIGVSSLEVIAWQALPEGETGIAVIDARRSQIYTAVYERREGALTMVEQPMLVQASELGRLSQRIDRSGLVVCGDTAAVAAEIEADPRLVPIPVTSPSPRALAKLAEQALHRGVCCDVHALAPLYIRRSDAEEKTRIAVATAKRDHC